MMMMMMILSLILDCPHTQRQYLNDNCKQKKITNKTSPCLMHNIINLLYVYQSIIVIKKNNTWIIVKNLKIEMKKPNTSEELIK